MRNSSPDHPSTRDALPDLARMMHSDPARVPVTLLLLAANILIFIAMLVEGAGLWHTASSVPLAWGANFGPATQDGQWWRLVSAMFLHFGVIHLALNMWALWDVGRLMEQLMGRWRFAVLYLGGGVIGNLLSLAVQGNSAVSGGASGAIFSLYGALLVFLWRERHQVERGEFRWFFGVASAFTVFALAMGQLVPGIDNAAHVGGLVAGALLGATLSRPWRGHSPRSAFAKPIAAALLIAGCSALIAQIPAPSYRLGTELQAREAIRQFLIKDQSISQQWESMLDNRHGPRMSFDQLAGRIDSVVTAPYQESFRQLSALRLDPAAPSARALEVLRNYAALRARASQALSEGLRARDRQKISRALENARKATVIASAVTGSAVSAPPDTR